jgi:hypothetical protein
MVHANDVATEVKDAFLKRLSGSNVLMAMLVQHLQEAGVPPAELAQELSSQFGPRPRPNTVIRLTEAKLERANWKIRFANLVSGRFTELVFLQAYNQPLHGVGLELVEETVKRNFLDFRINSRDPGEDFELGLNIKNAGVQMAQAAGFFGLAPEDTIPMATYKTFGAEEADIPPLLYVYLVDWMLIERLRDAYWRKGLTEGERSLFRLLASVKGFPRNTEDDFIAATVGHRLNELLEGVGYADLGSLPFRVISASRCQQIFYENHRRSPYVFVRRMNTDPNVHVSVDSETISFDDLMTKHFVTADARASLLAGLARKKTMVIPDPPL